MRGVLSAVAAAAVVAIPIAQAADAAGSTPARWLKKPTANDLLTVWPAEAWRRGLGGSAVIRCLITVQGVLRDCKVVSETPEGAHFGAAALALTPQFTFTPATKDGRPVESPATIPIKFVNPDAALGTHLPGAGPYDGLPIQVISNLVWSQAPTVAEVMAVYPPKARAEKVTGHVTLDCVLGGDGRLGNCAVAREEPKRYGFDRAARRLIASFRGPVVDRRGERLRGGHVHLPITFPADGIDNPSPVIGTPRWIMLPSAEEFSAAFPEAATKAGVLKARTVLVCTVAANGGLVDCKPLSEEPAGYGFGERAAGLAEKFRVSIWTNEGLPTIGGRVNVPIRYDLRDLQQATSGRA